VLDQARKAFGAQSVTLLERGRRADGAMVSRTADWTPIAVSGQPPPGSPSDACIHVPATDSLRLALRGRALPATGSSLGAFAALAAAALQHQRLAAAAEAAQPASEALRTRTALLACWTVSGSATVARASATNSVNRIAKINRVGCGAYCTSSPVATAPSPRPKVGAALLTSEPSRDPSLGCRSRRYALSTPMAAPVANPCTTRAPRSHPTPSAPRNNAMAPASTTRAPANTTRRPTWPDNLPRSADSPSMRRRTPRRSP
jgi:hypothetical protein